MKYLLRALCAIAMLCSISTANAQGTLPLALSQQFTINGTPMSGALLFTYVVGTVAQPQNTYQDTALTILNPWPLAADQNGRLPMFYMANGSTHVRLTDSTGTVQYDNPNVLIIGPSGGAGGGGGIDSTTVASSGDIKSKYGTGPIAGWVRCNGLTMGNATSGASERANADTQNLFVFLYNADPNLVVSGGRTGNALNDFNNSKTINLPDCRGRVIAALDDMGNSAAGRLTSTYFANGTTLGSAGGSQSHTQSVAEMPAHNHTASSSSSSSVSDPGHSHTYADSNVSAGGGGTSTFIPISQSTVNTSTAFTGISVSTTTSTTVNSNGSGNAFTLMQPTILMTTYIKL